MSTMDTSLRFRKKSGMPNLSSLNQGETGKEGQDRVWAFYRRQDNSADIDSKVERIVVKDGEVLEKNRPGERREQSLE